MALFSFVYNNTVAQTMTFDTGISEPGFSFSGFSYDGALGVLFPSSPNVNSQMVITKNSGCWDIASFNPYCWSGNCNPPGGGTWRAFSNKGDEIFFTIPTSQQPITLNWEKITSFTVQLFDPGTGNPNNTFNFDDVVYSVPSYVSPSTPSVSLVGNNSCPGSPVTVNISGVLNDGTDWKITTGGCGGTEVSLGAGNTVILNPTETTVYTIQGVDDCGCAAPSACVDFTVDVLTESTEFTSYVATPSDVFSCAVQEVTITATGGDDGTGALTVWYTEADGAGSVFSIGNPTTFITSSTVTYHARREGTCNNTNSIPVTITVNPDITFPTITCPPTVDFTDMNGPCDAAVIDLGNPVADDDCSFTLENDAPIAFPIGTTMVTWTATDGAGNAATCAQTVNYVCCIGGCDDSAACNYDPIATCDDGSCFFDCLGCTYANAANYNAGATEDDGSCEFHGCMDSSYDNYSALATVDDGTCTNYPQTTCQTDLNFDGLSNSADLLIFLGQFGLGCP